MVGIDTAPKIIYIAGTGRHGSTILGNVLGEFPGFVSVGELVLIWRDLYSHHLCGCGKDICECEFWSEVIRRAFGSLSKDDLWKLMVSAEKLARHFGGFYQQIFQPKKRATEIIELVNAYQAVYEAIQFVSKCNIIVDSSKTPLFEGLLVSYLPFSVNTIHLIRNPCAMSFSWETKKETPDPHKPFLPQYSLLATSFSWTAWNFFIQTKRNKNYLRLLYEDWAEMPQYNIEKIMRFINIIPPFSPFLSDKNIEIGIHHTVSGNPVRFQQGSLEIKSDERWRKFMPLYKKIAVLSLTWPLFLKYYCFDKKRDDGKIS